MSKYIFFSSLLFLLLLLNSGASFFILFHNKIYPRTFIAGINLSGRTKNEARGLLEASWKSFQERKLTFTYQAREWKLRTRELGLEIKIDQVIQDAFQKSRRRFFSCLLKPCFYSLNFSLKSDLFNQLIDHHFKQIETEPRDAQIFIEDQKIVLTPEIYGIKIDRLKLKQDLEEEVSHLNPNPLSLQVKPQNPEIKAEDLNPARDRAQDMVSRALVLSYQGKVWEVPALVFSDWIEFKKNAEGKIMPFVSDEAVVNYLTQNIAPEVAREPKNALFRTEKGKIVGFELARSGRDIDYPETIQRIEDYFHKSEPGQGVEIVLKEIEAEVNNKNADQLGLKSLLAVGESDFAGSPANRIHNIRVGASKFNGILVKPGEEFSFNRILGDVDARSGYKPELVIKPDGIKPEYGGGLCQLSTTAFRAMLKAGVPITQRQNHSLLVSYYKPYGTDATIYPGVHDLKFINDTPGYILIQTRIQGHKLFFDFFGTDDGRKVEITPPKFTSSFISPGPAKEILTDSLKRGQRKKVGNGFPGVSTVFYRTVVYPDGKVKKDKFFSKYKPWKAIYLVGTKE